MNRVRAIIRAQLAQLEESLRYTTSPPRRFYLHHATRILSRVEAVLSPHEDDASALTFIQVTRDDLLYKQKSLQNQLTDDHKDGITTEQVDALEARRAALDQIIEEAECTTDISDDSDIFITPN